MRFILEDNIRSGRMQRNVKLPVTKFPGLAEHVVMGKLNKNILGRWHQISKPHWPGKCHHYEAKEWEKAEELCKGQSQFVWRGLVWEAAGNVYGHKSAISKTIMMHNNQVRTAGKDLGIINLEMPGKAMKRNEAAHCVLKNLSLLSPTSGIKSLKYPLKQP